jgi:molybdenum cofactor cytidylyltransferase
MGENKLLLLKDNIPMVEHLFRRLSQINFHEVIVVTQYREVEELAESYGYRSIINNNPQRGISESIKLGVKNTDTGSDFMFFTGDQPFLRGEVIKKLMDISDNRYIAVPRLLGERKSPVIFGKIYREELLKLDGDRGGKEIIDRNLNSVRY